ncbi:MAG: lipoprotein signal peptidase [Arcobacteraceae bacterium]|nr:lipoprotein signal peptidase [Arcobacteraceae bacterium]
MLKKIQISLVLFVSLIFIDQYIKFIFVNGYYLHGDCISLVLAYNKGVAFSMFSFLEGNLKYIQIVMLLGGVVYLFLNKQVFKDYFLPISLLFAGGVSNIYDRFIHEGVVDYIYWHCGFDFAIFNLADILINISVAMILYINYKLSKSSKN